MTITATNNETRYFEEGVEVYPCRCGQTHYASDFDQYLIHNCAHDGETAVLIGPVDDGWDELRCQCSARVYKLR